MASAILSTPPREREAATSATVSVNDPLAYLADNMDGSSGEKAGISPIQESRSDRFRQQIATADRDSSQQ